MAKWLQLLLYPLYSPPDKKGVNGPAVAGKRNEGNYFFRVSKSSFIRQFLRKFGHVMMVKDEKIIFVLFLFSFFFLLLGSLACRGGSSVVGIYH